jgi:hypothetical protein
MRRAAPFAVILVLALAACSQGASTQMTDSPRPTPAGSSAPSLDTSIGPGASGDAKAQALTGRLGVSHVEGGCPYLEVDGTRYEVMYPAGWQANASTGDLRDPTGEVVARAGETITVRGSVASDMASTCQIGPIFRATAVEI